jgi:dTDP-4-dehydrorhamnose reductase
MIVLVGGSGYLGQAFAGALKKRSEPFLSVSRAQVDYTRYDLLVDFLSRTRCSFLINAAGYTGKPNVDACETARAETLQGNTLHRTMLQCPLVAQSGHRALRTECLLSGVKRI